MQTVTSSQPVHVTNGVLTIVFFVLWIIAVIRSPRKGHTFLFILACAVGGFLVATAIAVVVGNAQAGGALAALVTQCSGIAASINRLTRYRKSKTLKLP